jgi:uncharacterized ion transporter superfamily protein YfcC
MTLSEMADMFVDGCKECHVRALLVGLSRSISLVMEQGQVIDYRRQLPGGSGG